MGRGNGAFPGAVRGTELSGFGEHLEANMEEEHNEVKREGDDMEGMLATQSSWALSI